MNRSKPKSTNCRKMIRFCSLGLLIILTAGCTAIRAPSDDLSVPIAFEVNGAFVVSMKLPQAETESISDPAAFVVVEKSNSQQLFQAMYDPGRGENRGILLTRVWATVHRFSEPGRSELDNEFEREKTLFTGNDTSFTRNYLFDRVETIDNRNWLSVKLEGGISSGFAFVTKVNEEYA